VSWDTHVHTFVASALCHNLAGFMSTSALISVMHKDSSAVFRDTSLFSLYSRSPGRMKRVKATPTPVLACLTKAPDSPRCPHLLCV
jgi:hypothetical protein